MAVVYSDIEIESMVKERKFPSDKGSRHINWKAKHGHDEGHLNLNGDAGNEFRLILRKSAINELDFSIILAVRIPRSNQLFRLRRYNGNSHEHTNSIEETTFKDFHIHKATERYQAIGTREDAFAVPTSKYCEIHGAFQCLQTDCDIEVSLRLQSMLL